MANRRKIRTFKHQLVGIIFFCTLIPVISLSAILLYQIKENAESEIVEAIEKRLFQNSLAINQTIFELKNRLQEVSVNLSMLPITENLPASGLVESDLLGTINEFPAVEFVQVYDGQLSLLESTLLEPEALSSAEIFKMNPSLIPVEKGSKYKLFESKWLDKTLSEKTSRMKTEGPYIFLSTPLYSSIENTALPLNESGFLVAVLSLHKLINSPDGFHYELSLSPIELSSKEQVKGSTLFNYEVNVMGQAIYVDLRADTASLKKPVWEALQTIFVLAVIIIVLSIIAAYYFSQRLTAPFLQVEKIIQRYQDRNYYEPKPDLKYLEFERLHKVLLKMTQTIEKNRLDLEFYALHDDLTKLPSRRLLEQKIEEAISESIRGSKVFYIIFLDLNDFKPINDQYGHAAGDEVLRVLSKRLQNSLRQGDLCSRVGGDEFVILCEPGSTNIEITKVIKKLKETVQQSIVINNHYIHLDASAGYACYPKDGDNQDALMTVADHRMYQDKNAK